MKKITIGIIGGQGKMGQYFARFFERNGYPVIVSDQKTTLTNKVLAKKADVVIVAVPLDETVRVIEEVASFVKPSGLLMDLASLKKDPMEAMKKTRASYLGCHPLFGPTNSIEGQIVVLCPGKGQKWFKWLQDLLTENKVIVRTLDPKKHDELMAYVQVMSHFSDITLADALKKSGLKLEDFLSYQSPAYRLRLDMMGRILNQDARLYAAMQLLNPMSYKVIKNYLKSGFDLAKKVQRKDMKGFQDYFSAAAHYLGDFKGKAMEESDQLIAYVVGGGTVASPKQSIQKNSVAVLGPQGTYSDSVLTKMDPKAPPYYTSSISEIFEIVEKGKVKTGLVPLENSRSGSVRETLDELFNRKVWITSIIALPIHLDLAATEKMSLKSIEVIYSHPQALLQVRNFLKKHCPKALTIPVESTSAALDRLAREKRVKAAAIASGAAIESRKLVTLQQSIEDDPSNATSFGVIIHSEGADIYPRLRSGQKTLIAFHFAKDTPGSLYHVLHDFAEAKINLTKIESRPNPKIPGDHVFYIEFEGNPKNPKVKKVLDEIGRRVKKLKALGCY